MTPETQRFEILEMVQTTQHVVRTASLLDMVDFEPVGLAQPFVLGVRAGRRLVAATRAPVFVALLCRPPRERPPVIFPKGFGAAIAAPHLAPRGKCVRAPAACPVDLRCERA
ncbi:MAG: hypothetical protein WBD74_05565 [Candidatus Aquilonibacter sp.]